jgi:hypothetical protein
VGGDQPPTPRSRIEVRSPNILEGERAPPSRAPLGRTPVVRGHSRRHPRSTTPPPPVVAPSPTTQGSRGADLSKRRERESRGCKEATSNGMPLIVRHGKPPPTRETTTRSRLCVGRHRACQGANCSLTDLVVVSADRAEPTEPHRRAEALRRWRRPWGRPPVSSRELVAHGAIAPACSHSRAVRLDVDGSPEFAELGGRRLGVALPARVGPEWARPGSRQAVAKSGASSSGHGDENRITVSSA